MKNGNMDEQYIRECISTASVGTQYGEFPFGALVLFDGRVISKRHNESLHQKQVYRHAEMLALIDAQKVLTPDELSQSTLYSSVEPCPMCSFAIQELNIRRVVFGLRSPVMGGYTKWPVLQDRQINDIFPKSFGRPPDIEPDILKEEVIRGWREWNEEKWLKFVAKGVFVE